MTRLLFALLTVFSVQTLNAGPPPFKTNDPSIDENFTEAFNQLAKHGLNSDGSTRPGILILPFSADIDDAITSISIGQIIYNTAGLEVCISTQAGANTAWVKIQSPTSACAH